MKFLMLLGNLVQLSIGRMDVILFIHFLKLRLYQVLFFIYPSTIPSVGFIVAVKAFRIPSSSLSSDSSLGSMSLKVAARALPFPIDLRYVGHSYFICLNL